MIVKAVLNGREITYDVTFNKPEVYLMGPVTEAGDWTVKEPWALFTVPTTADGEFVSPAFAHDGSGNDSPRAYVIIPGHEKKLVAL